MDPFFQQQMQEAARLLQVAREAEARLGPQMMAKLAVDGPVQDSLGQTYARFDVATPRPFLPLQGYTMGLNDRVITVEGAANQQVIEDFNFDNKSAIFAMSAAVINTAGGAHPPTGYANSLDTFQVQFRLSQGTRTYQTNPVLGSAVFGTGSWPRYLGMPTWRINGGSVLQMLLTPLEDDLRIDTMLQVVELLPLDGI